MSSIPDDLLQAAARNELNILVGAGVSIDAGLPGWKDLLTELTGCISNTDARSAIQRLVSKDRLLDAAELLREEVSRTRIAERLREILGKMTEPSPIADAIWHLQPAFVMTTNYDSLLETAYARKFGKSARITTCGADTPGRLGDTSNLVGKLHGDLSMPDSIILSRGDYYRSSLSIMRDAAGISAEFVRRPTLAIGYSLTDPDLRLTLHWLEARLQGLSNAFFVLIPALPAEERRLLATLPGVVPLEYSANSGHRNPILTVLKALASSRDRTRRSGSPLEVHGVLLRTLHQQIAVLLHEANQPLSALITNASLIARHPPLAMDRMIKIGRDIERDVTRLSSELREVRDAMRVGHGHLSPSTWSECRKIANADLSKPEYELVSRSIAQERSAEVPVSAGLYSTLTRILINNALEASAPDQQVQVVAKFAKSEGRTFLVTVVRDSGSGIAAEIAADLFLPNASSKGEGRGLGLYLLRSLVEEVSGSVEFSSSPGKGTVASFRLPIAAPSIAADVIDENKRVTKARSLAGFEVLLLDDHPDVLKAISRVLEHSGATVACFKAGRDALRSIRSRKTPPTCIICDVVMPEMSGFEFARAVRERFADVPILFLTGYVYTSEYNQTTLLNLGPGRITTLEKPSHPRDIIDALLELTRGEPPVRALR